jgi:hypothetical protein
VTTCDFCGENLALNSLTATISRHGALRFRDTPSYDACQGCIEYGLTAMCERARLATETAASTTASRYEARRRVQLPVDEPRVDAAVRHDPERTARDECSTCGEGYDLNSADFTRLFSLLNPLDHEPGERVFLNPTPPCGHQQADLTVTVDADGLVTDVTRHPADGEACS